MNRRKDLRDLFRKSLASSRVVINDYRGRGCNYPYINRNWLERKICIYFYEWSDIYRVPRSFNLISEFEDYLKKCGIYMQYFQKEMILNHGTVYATCYKGSKELNMRTSYANLLSSMKENLKDSNTPSNTTNNNENKIMRPTVVGETEGRLDDYDEFNDYWFS